MSETKGLGLFVKSRAAVDDAAPSLDKPKNLRQRWLVVGGVVAVGAVVVSSLLSPPQEPLPVKKEDSRSAVSTTPKDFEQKTLQTVMQEQVSRLQAEMRELKAQNDRLADELKKRSGGPATQPGAKPSGAGTLPEGVVPPPVRQGDPAPLIQPPMPSVPPPPVPPKDVPPTPNLPPLVNPGAAPAVPEPVTFRPEPRADRKQPEAAPSEATKAKVSYKKNPMAGVLLANSFAELRLLHGLDAGTSEATRSNPQPVLFQVQAPAQLPGAARYAIRGCFILGSGHGELSSERVYFRLVRMSCVDKSERLVLSTPVAGYIVDDDNKLGLRGEVIRRQGALLAKAALANFAQGLSGALGQAQAVATTGPLGTTTSITGDAALRASGLAGAQGAANQLAQFYLKEAQSIFPIIAVDGGRRATVVFTEDVSLEWGSAEAKFTREVKPE